MEACANIDLSLDDRIARRLKALRREQGWSLDALSGRCGVSRATLSRLENGAVSPTATVLGKLCAAYALTMSRLMAMVETGFAPLVPRERQTVWRDPVSGFVRRSLSPPTETLAAEVLECEIPAGTRIDYERPPRSGLEHHIVVLDGALVLTLDGHAYWLGEGDCLRYRLFGASRFETARDRSARYILVTV